jgi:hypothetical protein
VAAGQDHGRRGWGRAGEGGPGLFDAAETVLGFLGQGPQDRGLDLDGNRWDQLARGKGRFDQMPDQHLPVTPAVEWHPPAQHLVKDDSQRVDIGTRVDLTNASTLLGRHVSGCSEQRRSRGVGGRVTTQLGHAKVEQDHAVGVAARLAREEHVFGLEIAVNDPLFMGGLERRRGWPGNGQRLGQGKRTGPLEPASQGFPFQVLHHQEGKPILQSTDVEHLDDVPVAYRVHRTGFVHEARDHAAVLGEHPANDLDHRPALGDGMLGEIDRTHSTLTDETANHVVVDDLTDHRRSYV